MQNKMDEFKTEIKVLSESVKELEKNSEYCHKLHLKDRYLADVFCITLCIINRLKCLNSETVMALDSILGLKYTVDDCLEILKKEKMETYLQDTPYSFQIIREYYKRLQENRANYRELYYKTIKFIRKLCSCFMESSDKQEKCRELNECLESVVISIEEFLCGIGEQSTEDRLLNSMFGKRCGVVRNYENHRCESVYIEDFIMIYYLGYNECMKDVINKINEKEKELFI